MDEPVKIGYDNLSTIWLASNPIIHAQMKHIEVRYVLIWEKVLQEYPIKVDTNVQVVDIFNRLCPKENLNLSEVVLV